MSNDTHIGYCIACKKDDKPVKRRQVKLPPPVNQVAISKGEICDDCFTKSKLEGKLN